MKTFVAVVIATALFMLAGVTAAATKTVTLAVKNMTCAICPITVKKALNGVVGVSRIEVSYERKEALVTFDDAKTNVEALIEATTNAGYPASVKTK
jgi:mercuric ion binding protein